MKSKKCNKFESIFVFRNSEKFQEHLNNCPDCLKKYNEMLKAKKLIRSAKSLYLKRKKSQQLLSCKIAACFVFLILSSLCINLNPGCFFNIHNKKLEIADFTSNSIFNKMHLPTDEYGILNVDKELTYAD